jgi:hypothetical protein
MKLSAKNAPCSSGEIPASPWKVSGWLRTTLLQASCISQSAVAAGAYGIDFFDPTAVRAANREVLRQAAEPPCDTPACGILSDELAVPFPPPV